MRQYSEEMLLGRAQFQLELDEMCLVDGNFQLQRDPRQPLERDIQSFQRHRRFAQMQQVPSFEPRRRRRGKVRHRRKRTSRERQKCFSNADQSWRLLRRR